MVKYYNTILSLIRTNIETILKCDYATGHLAEIYVDVLIRINEKQYFESGDR